MMLMIREKRIRKKILWFLAGFLLFSILDTGVIEAKGHARFADLTSCGITVKHKAYYYQEKRIRIFQDIRADKSFIKSFVDKKGTVDIRILRDAGGSIKKVKRIPKKKAKKILKDLQ